MARGVDHSTVVAVSGELDQIYDKTRLALALARLIARGLDVFMAERTYSQDAGEFLRDLEQAATAAGESLASALAITDETVSRLRDATLD